MTLNQNEVVSGGERGGQSFFEDVNRRSRGKREKAGGKRISGGMSLLFCASECDAGLSGSWNKTHTKETTKGE